MAGIVAVIVSTGCGRSGNSPAAPLTSQQQSLLYQAEQRDFGDCLRAAGFRYWPIPESPPGVFDLYPYVITDTGWAARHGFGGDQARNDRAAAQDPNARYATSLPPDRQQALSLAENGRGPSDPGPRVTLPTGGVVGQSGLSCTARAEGALYGDFATWFRVRSVVDDLPGLWQREVVEDPAYHAALAGWSRCMAAAGEPYPSPTDAADAFLNPTADQPRDAEVRAATAEATCAGGSGLAAVARRLDEHYAGPVRARYRAQIDRYRTMARRALPRARSVLDGA